MNRLSALVLLSHVWLYQAGSSAFQPFSRSARPWRRKVAADTILQVEEQSKKLVRKRYNVIGTSDPSALTFSGQIIKTSQPLVSMDNKDLLIDFFKSPQARDTLFVSDAAPIPVEPVPSKLFREWQLETQRFGIALPTREEDYQQTVRQLCSEGISFSGLTVETTVNCGAKLIEESPDTGLPAYELTMINDSTEARGPRPLMWIYNQVMGFVSNKSQTKTTTSLCRIALVEQDGGIAIDFESSFLVKMNFPPFLMRILPVSKTKAENQGSSAVTRFVQKGVVDSLGRFEQAFFKSMKLAP